MPAAKPNNPKLWSASKAAAKRKFDVYPSAYANAWAAKNYKAKGGGWRKSETVNEAKSEKDFKLGTPVVFDGDSGEVVSNAKHQRVWTPSGRTMVGKGVKEIMKYGSNSFFVPDWSKTKQFNESVNESKSMDMKKRLKVY